MTEEPKNQDMNLDILCRLYIARWQPHSLDRLAHTPEIKSLRNFYNEATGQKRTRKQIWDTLIDLRKRGVLPTRGRNKKGNEV